MAGIQTLPRRGTRSRARRPPEAAYLAAGESLVAGDGFARDGDPELHFPPLIPLLGAGGKDSSGVRSCRIPVRTNAGDGWPPRSPPIVPCVALRPRGRRLGLHRGADVPERPRPPRPRRLRRQLAALRPALRRPAVAAAGVLLVGSSVGAFMGPGGWWHPVDHTDQQAAGEWVAARTDPATG